MSDGQYSSPKAVRVNAGKATARDAGDLANGYIEANQDVYDIGETFPDTAEDWYTPQDRRPAN